MPWVPRRYTSWRNTESWRCLWSMRTTICSESSTCTIFCARTRYSKGMRLRRWISSGLLILMAACSDREGPTGDDFQEVPASMIVIGMTEYMTAAGLRRARLKGDTAYVHDDSGKVKVKGVNLL